MVIVSWYWPEGLPWSVTLSEAMSVGLPVWEWLPEGGGNRLAVWREGEYPAMLSAPWVCPEVLPVRTHTSPHTQPVNYHISCHLCILLSKNWNRAIIVNGHMPPPPSLVSLAHVTLSINFPKTNPFTLSLVGLFSGLKTYGGTFLYHYSSSSW